MPLSMFPLTGNAIYSANRSSQGSIYISLFLLTQTKLTRWPQPMWYFFLFLFILYPTKLPAFHLILQFPRERKSSPWSVDQTLFVPHKVFFNQFLTKVNVLQSYFLWVEKLICICPHLPRLILENCFDQNIQIRNLYSHNSFDSTLCNLNIFGNLVSITSCNIHHYWRAVFPLEPLRVICI